MCSFAILSDGLYNNAPIITDNGNSAMTAPAALEILNDVFGYPSFRGRQAEIVETLAGGKACWC
ncbi:hypothetical protein NEIELOOT_00032 [Neisseria elongata subsp. glycolytica ATCC 29315]|uniref:Uncharacterized protein n=1 Tax=Neisseria elongata subsp. glycolytica ATCC 29315 TaxID=546263 RepID=D4DLX2_NEIEG|nr:hypothetical protein NEIELOOT_00032 [Neisseria elongata subsp. glycolytica ATCC 29315]